ncbi:MAG: sensor histidine kinase [Deltaproteobacteria bacterium]|nr:sensor histidine kinase [Deltaproteobacteria bacterium]
MEDEEKLQAHLRAIIHRSGRTLALFLACFGVLRLPVWGGLTELGTPQSVLRISVVTLQLATYALMRTRFAERRPLIALAPGALLIMVVSGFEAGKLGDAQHPWIFLSFPSLCLTVVAPVGLGQRIFIVAFGLLGLLAGFLVPHPEYLALPMTRTMLGFAFVVGVMVTAVGHVTYRVTRQSFHQSLALERASTELSTLNATLETRVREQTSELRRLADHLESAREDERTRISHDLHDELGQELTALHLGLSLTRERFTRDPKSIEGNLADLTALLGRTRTTVRRIVTELRPRLIDDLGLQASVEWLIRETEQRSQLRCRLSASALEDLPGEVSADAFRIVQEALTNVVRHAEAKNVDVRLDVRGPGLEIEVADDGVGIRKNVGSTGVGLIGIRERASAHS